VTVIVYSPIWWISKHGDWIYTNTSKMMEAAAPEVGKMAMRRPFDPAAHELDANFRLTRFADLKG